MQSPKKTEPTPQTQPTEIENIVVDEANELTYVVMANRVLNDGELYSAIRVELLKRGSKPAKGQRLVIPAVDLARKLGIKPLAASLDISEKAPIAALTP